MLQVALIHDSPVTGTKASYTYAQMLEEVATLAAVLQDLGVGKGDVVAIYLPMIPEAVISMLACARLGAPHTVVFGGFSAQSLRDRIEAAEAQALETLAKHRALLEEMAQTLATRRELSGNDAAKWLEQVRLIEAVAAAPAPVPPRASFLRASVSSRSIFLILSCSAEMRSNTS